MKGEVTVLRKRLQKSSQNEFIIDLAQPPEEVEFHKDRCASQFQEIVDSWVEIHPENEAKREEDHVSEMGDGSHLEIETVPNEGRWPKDEESIIRPKRRVRAGSSGQKYICAGNTLL